MEERLLEPKKAMTLALVILLLAVPLGDTLRRESGAQGPGAVVRSGRVFAEVLGGVRMAAAAYIWIKIDNAGDNYYGGRLANLEPLMPLYRISTWLDPRQERAYFVASFVLWRQRRIPEAIAFAQEGVVNNPRSPLLVFNLGQLYFLQGDAESGRKALRYLSQAERMTRSSDAGTRLQVLTTLHAALTRFRKPEPKWLDRELARVRAWIRANPPEKRAEEEEK